MCDHAYSILTLGPYLEDSSRDLFPEVVVFALRCFLRSSEIRFGSPRKSLSRFRRIHLLAVKKALNFFMETLQFHDKNLILASMFEIFFFVN